MPRTNEKQKKIRQYRVKNHLCYDCGKKLPKHYDRTRCGSCLKKENQRGEKRCVKNRKLNKQLEEKMFTNKKYIKDLKECREKHLCYGCRKPLPKGYSKARCLKCLKYQRSHRVKKDVPVVPQLIKQVEVEDKGELIQHIVVVDENIEIGIKIPQRLGYGEIMALFDNISRMMKPFMKQEQMFGQVPTYKTKRKFISFSNEQKKQFVKIWDNNKKATREVELVKVFPKLAGLSYVALSKRYYSYK